MWTGYTFPMGKHRFTGEERDLWRREREEERKGFLNAIKLERGCMDCGYRTHAVALHFDHRPGEEKLFSIGNATCRTWSKVLAEIEKCDVVCANCHVVRTATRASWRGLTEMGRSPAPSDGTSSP